MRPKTFTYPTYSVSHTLLPTLSTHNGALQLYFLSHCPCSFPTSCPTNFKFKYFLQVFRPIHTSPFFQTRPPLPTYHILKSYIYYQYNFTHNILSNYNFTLCIKYNYYYSINILRPNLPLIYFCRGQRIVSIKCCFFPFSVKFI